MNIKLTSNYKSLKPMEALNLPDFVVLTGLNGSGKTQLLQLLSETIRTFDTRIDFTNNNEEKFKDILFFSFDDKSKSFNPLPGGSIRYKEIVNQIDDDYQKYNSFKIDKKISNTKATELQESHPSEYEMYILIAQYAQKDITDLEIHDFYQHFPLDYMYKNRGAYDMELPKLFIQYRIKQIDNVYNKMLHEKDSTVSFLNEIEFYQRYGSPPWETINNILNEMEAGFQVNYPTSNYRETPFQLLVCKNDFGVPIYIDFSAGEKVILALAFSLFNAQLEKSHFPQVLLLDEPDAPLHPSMVKHLLKALQKVYVKNKQVKVIMTTHSPTTVALSPEKSIYEIVNNCSINKISKNAAIRKLLDGVPSISVGYENRKQVFVEGSMDLYFYEKIYTELKNKLNPEISLNFIVTGNGSSDVNQVKCIVKKLACDFRNKSIFGIVDWDGNNKNSDHVFVPGGGKRYAIENYIFDPILLGAFLLRKLFLKSEELGLQKEDDFYHFVEFDDDKLGMITEKILEKLKKTCKTNSKEEGSELSKLICGRTITLPRWFYNSNGHELEIMIKKAFPQLKRYQKEQELKVEMINTILVKFPGLLSIDLLELFSGIQQCE